jgi:hypothetical protein
MGLEFIPDPHFQLLSFEDVAAVSVVLQEDVLDEGLAVTVHHES